MAIEYLGLSQINGSLIAIEGMKDAAYDEVVESKKSLAVSLPAMRIRR